MGKAPDQRKHPRLEVILKVEYESSVDFLADYAFNASDGGLFVATSRPFGIGDKLSFSISFPGLLDPIRCNAEVRWRRNPENASDEEPAGIGVAFVFDSLDEAGRIRQLIDELSRASGPEQPDIAACMPFRVLLAEDNPMVREMFRFAIRKFHRSKLAANRELKVVEAEDGKIAWEHLRSGAFDLAIIDYYMPVMDGGQLIRRIRGHEDFRTLPVIVVSVGGEEARKESYAAGADLYLDKPVLLGQLFESLQRLLGLAKSEGGS